MQRQFTSGSRQAPDPFDQFLEEHQFYRKHTARDASCLFRVISEQMYDTQLHHLAIREKCVTYMRKHRKYFDYLVDQDFDEYLDDMSKPKTYGTLVELQAAGYMFERNVFLFEPFNLGTYFNDYRVYFKEVFRVFYTPERHFDSVFTSDYIQEAAICQSICYEILYKDLFKLPDVSFAVEQMLHGPTFENTEYRTETNENGYSTRLHLNDGRTFELDLPQNTNCILENYKLCHFHYSNFPRFSDDLQRELKFSHCEEYDKNPLLIQRTAESFLPNKYVSCVRQLLLEGITPFPYKVAKALDPNMYRNIEFDSWNEMRKELKLQNWYNGDANFKIIRYSTRRVRKIFQVGAKCHVKLRRSEQDLYTCHIQEIAVDKGQCIVFVEQLGEKRLVPYENLTPLPADQFKPWTVPYRFQRHMQKYSSVRYTRQYNYRFKFNATTEHHLHHHGFGCGSGMDNDSCSNDYMDDDLKKPQRPFHHHHQQHCSAAAASYYKLKQYTHLENFRMRTDVEYCTMPLTVEHSSTARADVDANKSNTQQRAGDSSENSRTPSRSSTAVTIQHNTMVDSQVKSSATSVCNAGDEHLATPIPMTVPHMEVYNDMEHYNPNGAVYMQDLQGFYPMYPYTTGGGMPEDYYGYCGYDVGMPPGTAFMPAVNSGNGIYYVCNNAIAPPGNYLGSGNPYMPPPPPPPAIGLPQPSPMLPSANTPNSAGFTHTPYAQGGSGTVANSQPSSLAAASNNSVTNTPSRLANRGNQSVSTTTPLSGRINYEAKKSMKANGADLPPDVATLRYFYNLGLDFYQKDKSKEVEKPITDLNDEAEKVTNEFQNIKLDENANQISSTKSDANNNNLHATQSNDSCNSNDNQSNKHENTVGNSSSTTGNKNNTRRYSSRYFRGKDTQMSQRYNNTNHQNAFNNGQHHHHNQSHNNQAVASRNLGTFNNNKYATNNHISSTTPNSSRNIHSQSYGPSSYQHNQHHQHQSQQQHLSHPTMIEQSIQTSPMCGFDDAVNRANSTDSHNCHTPTANNTNPNQVTTYGSYLEPTNDGINNAAPMVMPMPNANGGVYIQMPMTTGPPPPYGLFPPHPSQQVAGGMGMHPNYMTGPPPQFNPHGMPPLAPNLHGTTNSTASSDCAESEMMANNGLLGMGTGGMHLPCPNFPPPMPFYYSASGIAPSGSGGPGLATSANGGVHLVPPLAHHQVAPPTSSNQNGFSIPHSSMGSQGYFCLPPPPPAGPQQMPTQQMPLLPIPQPSPMSNNRSPLSGIVAAAAAPIPQDVNNITRAADIPPVPNND